MRTVSLAIVLLLAGGCMTSLVEDAVSGTSWERRELADPQELAPRTVAGTGDGRRFLFLFPGVLEGEGRTLRIAVEGDGARIDETAEPEPLPEPALLHLLVSRSSAGFLLDDAPLPPPDERHRFWMNVHSRVTGSSDLIRVEEDAVELFHLPPGGSGWIPLDAEIALDWRVRSRVATGLLQVLYLPAVAFDVATSPLQIGFLFVFGVG